jgi:hypothetical protein
MANVTVVLISPSGSVLAATTDTEGYYSFTAAPSPSGNESNRYLLQYSSLCHSGKSSASFQGEQKLAQLVGHRRRYPFVAFVFIELTKPFVAKATKLHLISSLFHYVRSNRTRQASLGQPLA